MNAPIESAEKSISVESIRADYQKKLTDLFVREAEGIIGIDWRISSAVINKRPYFDMDLKTNSEVLEEWMRPAFAGMLAETRSRLDDVSIHHMNVESFKAWRFEIITDRYYSGPYHPAFVRLRFHFNAETEAEQPAAPAPKQSWLDAMLRRPKPIIRAPEKKFIMTLE